LRDGGAWLTELLLGEFVGFALGGAAIRAFRHL
jgi:hypothetical protein